MEEVPDQIDRLNQALQQVMGEIANSSIEKIRKISMSSNWLENFSDESSIEIPEDFEKRLEGLLLDLDRSKMVVEDFCSEKFRNLKKTSLTVAELRELMKVLNNLYSEGKCVVHIGNEDFEISLVGSIDNREITMIENSILECGHDITKIKKEIAIDVESKIQGKKNKIISEITKNFENQLEELDKLKQSYAEKLKDLANFSLQVEKKEKNLELRELKLQKNTLHGRLPDKLEERLKELEAFASLSLSETEPKTDLKIEQLKNKIISLRAEKVISESKQTTSVLSRILKAMEREVSFEEKQRKKLFEKCSESHSILQTDIERPSISTIKKLEENFRIYMEKVRVRLKSKELELLEKEKKLNESWIPENSELVNLMKSTLDKLYEQREENEKEREILEREKLDIVNLNEQIIGILINIENIKKNGKAEWAELVKQQISLLNVDPRQLGF